MTKNLLSVITYHPLILSPDRNMLDAISMMDENSSSYVLGGKENNVQTLGIFTERDLIRICCQHLQLDRLLIQDVMNPCIMIQASEITDLTFALTLFQKYQTRYLVVLEGDRLIGVIAKENLIELFSQAQMQLESDLQIEDAKFWATEQRSQKLFDGLPKISVQGYRRDRQVIYWNKASEKIYGYTSDEALGQNLENLIIPPAMRQDVINLVEAWVNGGDPIPASELTLLAKDGSSVYVYSSHVLLNNSRNEPELYCIDIDLSEHRQAEAALKHSEAQCRAILDAIPDLMFRVGADGIYREFIKNRDFGILPSDSDPTGQSMAELMPEEIANHQFYYMKQALLTGELQMYEQQIQIDNRLQDEEVRVIKSGNDEVLFMIRNISDRKQAEAALKQSEFQNRAILAAIPDLMFRVGADGIYRGFVQNRDFGILPLGSDPTGQSIADLMSEEIANQQLYYMQQALLTGELQVYEQQIQIDNRLQDEEVRVIKSGDDEALFMIRNISDRKQAEADLKQSEMTNRTIIETLPDLLIQMDMDGRYLRMLAGSAVRVLCPPNLHEQPEVFKVLPADLAEQRLHYAKQAITTGILQIYEQIFTFEDEQRYEEVRIAPLNDREVLIIIRDITDAKQVEFERSLNEELIRATRLKDEFLANMSHELRTPLNAILGMTEGLQEQVFGNVNGRQIKALKTIEQSGSHLLELINDILDVAKIDSGHLELDCRPTAIAPLCNSSLVFIKQQAHKKGIKVKMIVPPNLPDLVIDERRIRQVLINLLNNAVKFTPKGGHITLKANFIKQSPPPLHGISKVRVFRTLAEQELAISPQEGCEKVQDYLRITVIDTGIGIAPENISKLFQPFVQIDSALNRQYTGTGLGLSLVKRIVEMHGGEVGLASELGVGSCLTIDLPSLTPIIRNETNYQLDQVLEESIGENKIHIHEDNQENNQPIKQPLILLAEDNEANIVTFSSYLKAKGYRLIVAKNGEEAIALVQTEIPDLILMDIQMPKMDGLEAIQHIRQDLKIVDMPIIALTALAMPGDRERCLAAGANDYLSKPVKLKQLVSMIQQMLGVS